MKKQIFATLLAANIALAQSPVAAPPTAPPPVDPAGLVPNSNLSKAPVNDPFFGYQWGLKNEGQTYTPLLSDIYLGQTISSNPKVQIGWKNYDSQMKRDVNLAIADSGIYTGTFAEFTGRLVKGYNFTDPKNTGIYDDKLGHGTHMAGIIGANMNNGEGIAGMTNRVKIMPLQVYSGTEKSATVKPDDVTTPMNSNGALSTRVIKALDYAIQNKIDVMNMSLGWPRVQDTEEVHNAFKRAADAGIIMVVAAGNDGNNLQTYPCSYREVICVGSVNMDGQVSNFSNYGGHVDLAAPGQAILSTIPPLSTVPSVNFGISGYDTKNGTSQSTAFVLGAAAILRGLFPNETAKQIRARLLLGAQPISNKFAFGLLNIEKSASLTSLELTAPILKGINDATVDVKTGQFKFPVLVEKTSSKSSKSPKVSVQSLSSGVQIGALKKISETDDLAQYEATGNVSSLATDSRLAYRIDVNGRSTEASLTLRVGLQSLSPAVYPLSQNEGIQKNGLFAISQPQYSPAVRYWTFVTNADHTMTLTVWTLKNNQMQEQSTILPAMDKPLNTFNLLADDFDFDGQLDYLLIGVRNLGTADEGADFVYLNSDLKIKHRLPMEFGPTIPLYTNPKEMVLAKTTLPDGRPLKVPAFWNTGSLPKMDSLHRYDPTAGEKATQAEWAAAEKARQEAAKSPPFSEAALATHGQVLAENDVQMQRLYYYQPSMVDGNLKMVLRTLTSNISEKALRRLIYNQEARQILSKPALQSLISREQVESALANDTVSFLIQNAKVRAQLSDSEAQSLLSSGIQLNMRFIATPVQSNAEIRDGQFSLLLNLGRGVVVDNYKVTFRDLTKRFEQAQIEKLTKFPYDLSKGLMREAISLKANGLEGETSFSAVFSFISARTLLFRNDQLGGIDLSLPDRSDAIATVTKSFAKGRDLVSFVETAKTMQVQGTWNSRPVNAKIPLYRSSFYGTKDLFSQSFVPVVISRDQLPGLVVNNSLISSNSASVFSLDKEGQLTSLIKRSIEIPDNCRMLRNTWLTSDSYSRLAFICRENEKIDLRLLDLQ